MIKMPSAKSLVFLLLWVLAPTPSWADQPEFEFHAPAAAADPGTPAVMRDLAERILPVYEEHDPALYLENLSALQLVAGDYQSAYDTRKSLQDRRQSADPGRPVDRALIFDLYAQARALEASGGAAFAGAFKQSFRQVVPQLNDSEAYAVTAWLEAPLPPLQNALQTSFDQLRGKPSITLDQAIDLIWTYLAFDAYRSFGPLADTLGGEEDHRRYLAEDEVLIKTRGGAKLHVRVVRPKSASKALPALLEFSIFGLDDDAEACAAHGYVGVAAYISAKGKGRGSVVPFRHDGEDVRAVIAWIAKQPWSDGRVGMYGDGYSGFAAWAAAKRLPSALKAIATSDAMAPGIDFPMQGRIYRNAALRWAAANTQGETESGGEDDAQWPALDQAWYRSGTRYRDLDRLVKKPRPSRIFHRWLNHPSYDRYWQKMIPFGKQFARIDIPVLATTGYYADGAAGALYYFTQHYRYKPDADHTLVIGPYDDRGVQVGPSAVLRAYAVDSAALIDLHELRYQWFDHVLKGAAKPALLQDRVNYEVMGANQWRHAPSLEAMANGALRFYLDAKGSAEPYRLAQAKPKGTAFIPLSIDFADRRDGNGSPPTAIISKSLAVHNDLRFVSEPLRQPLEVNGLLSAWFDFKVNKMDADLNLSLYELLPGGDYLQLCDPYEFRASYAQDRVHRHLLKSGERQQLSFDSERVMSRQIQAGSRLVLVLGVNKRPDREINYGAGNDVSEESIKDARIPLKIRWYGGSYIDVPVLRQQGLQSPSNSPHQVDPPPPAPPDERKNRYK